MTNAAASSNLSSSHCWKRDVFLSFRGEDTRRGFTDHLYNALKQKGVDTFRDDEKLERGKDISPELLRSIEESRFAVVIFSRNYACSKWCLDELQKIAECKKNLGQIVLPVFYGVDPSNVRKQGGDFRAAFDKHEQDFKGDVQKVNKWREALTEVANVSGWDSTNRHESEVIEEIVKTILTKLNLIFSSVSKDLVGIDSRMRKMDSYLDIESDEVRTIGIWGAGGMGKTTIAKQVFKRIRDGFEASCFLANVREESQKHGIVHVQTRLHEMLIQNQANIQMDDMGVDVLKRALHSKRVLVVLDDVDQFKQLEALVGKASEQHRWFGSGSRIIITTRDKHLLKVYGNIVYEVEKLNNAESLQLFCQKAFSQDYPPDDHYNELSKNVVEYADGLPLALEVLGSFLYGRGKDEWSGTISRLRDSPKSEIYTTLRLSYDGLEQTEKQIFLDIACFFKGEDADCVKKIHDSCGFHPTIGIRVLNEKSLVFIEGGKLWMHDLLQEMGWQIVREESLQEPGKRSRLWLHEDSYRVLAENKGTYAVHGIFLCSPSEDDIIERMEISIPSSVLQNVKEVCWRYPWPLREMHLNCDPFEELKNLRLLKICNVKISGCRIYSLPKSLRLLEWQGYPLESLPSQFQPTNLVELRMPDSHIEQLWKLETVHLGVLTLIDLSHCESLISTPDFTKIPNLETLVLEGCIKLQEVHPSVGVLKHLVLLNLTGCRCLQKLPEKISLRSLKTFSLSGCSNLIKFPEIVGDMKNLSQLYLDGTAIWELPISINQLSGLTLLDLSYCKNVSGLPSNDICSLTALKTLNLAHCSKIDRLPENLGSLKELEELYADGTAVRKVPSSILHLDKLKYLTFRGCHNVSGVQRSWKSLICCCSLRKEHHPEVIHLQLPGSFAGLTSLIYLRLSQCNLEEGAIPNDIGCLSSLQYLDLSGNNFMTIPESFSQLSKLRQLDLSNCRELTCLPRRLPLSLAHLYARNCPKLETEPSHCGDTEILISDNGVRFIDCRKSLSFGNNRAFVLRDSVPIKDFALLQKFIEDEINEGRRSVIRIFPYPAEIPEWCNKWSNGSSIKVKLSPAENFGQSKGLVLFLALEKKNQDNVHEDWELQKTLFLFHTDDGRCFQNLQEFAVCKAGSFGVWCYFPRRIFGDKYLNQLSSLVGVSVLIMSQDLEIQKCGLRIVLEQDVEEISQKLSETQATDAYKRHCKFLDPERELNYPVAPKRLGIIASGEEQGSEEPQQEEHLDQTWNTNDQYPSSEDCVDESTVRMRRDTQALLSRLFEGRYVRNNLCQFIIPPLAVWRLFLHHCVGDTAVCYLPSNLYDDNSWVGLEFYAIFGQSNPSESNSSLFVDLFAHGADNGGSLFILTCPLVIPSFVELLSSVVFHVPRERFSKQLNQCQGISVLFRPLLPPDNVKVGFRVLCCGTRLLYEQDSKSFIQRIIDITSIHPIFLKFLHDQAKFQVSMAEELTRMAETHKQRRAVPLEFEWPFLQSLQKLMTSKEPLAKYVSSFIFQDNAFYGAPKIVLRELGPILFHSKESGVENQYLLKNALSQHLHIMPDKVLGSGGKSVSHWKDNLDLYLKVFIEGHGLLITLSVGGELISVTDCFDPKFEFNFCFPRKEILEWFQVRSSGSVAEIELPLNLYDDSSWAGLAVCAAFSVNEHQNACSKTFVELACHLSANGRCLNPVPFFYATKDRYKWQHIRGFIWLTYLPRLILTELNQQRNVEARILGSCPGLAVKTCGIRLLYHQDVEELRRAIIQCSFSIFGTSEFFQFVDPHGVGTETLHADDDHSRVLDESSIDQFVFHQTSNEEFDQNSIYNSCFAAIEIQEWFGDQHRFGSSGKIYLPPDTSDGNNWIGLTMCAYFSDLEISYIDNDSDRQNDSHVTLICQFETERGIMGPLYHHQTTQDLNLLHQTGFMWLSFLPRRWFYEANHRASCQLNECRVMLASFHKIQGLTLQSCAFRLLYQHDEEEFRQTIRHCILNTSSPCDEKRSEGSVDTLRGDKGKRILE